MPWLFCRSLGGKIVCMRTLSGRGQLRRENFGNTHNYERDFEFVIIIPARRRAVPLGTVFICLILYFLIEKGEI